MRHLGAICEEFFVTMAVVKATALLLLFFQEENVI